MFKYLITLYMYEVIGYFSGGFIHKDLKHKWEFLVVVLHITMTIVTCFSLWTGLLLHQVEMVTALVSTNLCLYSSVKRQ